MVRENYVAGWRPIALELQRIARVPPDAHGNSIAEGHRAQTDAEQVLDELPWDRVYDFCERLHGHLAQAVGYRDRDDDFLVTTARSEVQTFIATELQRLFVEESLAFVFDGGVVQRRGRRHTVEQVSRAEVVLADPRLEQARKHYEKALRFFRHPSKPDHENAIKEAVCAVEAAAKALFREAKAATLGDATKWLTGTEPGKLPKTVAQTFIGLYGFRSGGEGVGHGGASGGAVTSEIAEFTLAVAASQIILLVDLAKAREYDIPF